MGVKWRRSGPWVGMVGLLVALWFYGFVALVAPWWVVPIMLAVWLVFFVAGLLNFSRRPLLVLALPFVAMGLWFGVISAGGAWWGWTA